MTAPEDGCLGIREKARALLRAELAAAAAALYWLVVPDGGLHDKRVRCIGESLVPAWANSRSNAQSSCFPACASATASEDMGSTDLETFIRSLARSWKRYGFNSNVSKDYKRKRKD